MVPVVLAVAGAVVFVAGLALVSVPGAVCVAGLLLVAAGWLAAET